MVYIKRITSKIYNFFDPKIPLIETKLTVRGKLIGFMFHHNLNDSVFISQVRIAGEYRGIGLGKDLLKFNKDIYLFVQNDNIKGIRFY